MNIIRIYFWQYFFSSRINQCEAKYVHTNECQAAGGVCRVKGSCPIAIEDREFAALCDTYRQHCCLKEKSKGKRCISNEGTCKPVCPPIAREYTATDCPRSFYCCLF